MINKSKVRQATLNMLYAVEENGGTLENFDSDLFWRITQEKETDHFRTALAKALVHATRASVDSQRLLETRIEAVLNTMHGDMTAASLVEDIERLQKRSAEFESALAAMRYCIKDKRQDTTDDLEKCSRFVMDLAVIVEGLGRELMPKFEDFPAYRAKLDSLRSAIMRRGKQMALCAAMRTPLALKDQNEYVGLVRCAEMLDELRPQAEKMALAIIAKRDEYEQKLTTLLQNYSTARMDVVDKCIIYLSFYEMEVNKLDIPIVVSEATALADAYSGGKSAPFIHGIISAASKA